MTPVVRGAADSSMDRNNVRFHRAPSYFCMPSFAELFVNLSHASASVDNVSVFRRMVECRRNIIITLIIITFNVPIIIIIIFISTIICTSLSTSSLSCVFSLKIPMANAWRASQGLAWRPTLARTATDPIFHTETYPASDEAFEYHCDPPNGSPSDPTCEANTRCI